MEYRLLDGAVLKAMLENGLRNLAQNEQRINDMNVFPVPDGDTGTNMRLTLQHGLESITEDMFSVGSALAALKSGMLLGARGNSGVILSQFFAGLSESVGTAAYLDVDTFAQGLVKAYKTAYGAVANPVEGTILSVAKEGIEAILPNVSGMKDMSEFLSSYQKALVDSLYRTPEQLPTLEEHGVLDSGACGYITIVTGMLDYLEGRVSQGPDYLSAPKGENHTVNLDAFGADSTFDYGYCMEFFLQLMADRNRYAVYDHESFLAFLNKSGNSLVCIQDKDRVRVHVHTFSPAPIIMEAQKYGEFLTFKLENMALQHNGIAQKAEEKAPHKAFATVAVASGEGIEELYRNLGCDIVIDCGDTLNASANDFLEAFNSLDADTIAVLPNDRNTLQVARQAVSLYGKDNVQILPSMNIVQGYYALAMSCSEEDNLELKLLLMKEGIDSIDSILITKASKAYQSKDIHCKAGDYISLINGELVVSSEDFSVLLEGILAKADKEEKENCVVFRGSSATDAMTDELVDAFSSAMPDVEVSVLDGGQGIYSFAIGL